MVHSINVRICAEGIEEKEWLLKMKEMKVDYLQGYYFGRPCGKLATLIWFGLSYLVSSVCLLWLTVALILVFTLAGIWAANRLEASWGEDPSRVVVDEMVGVWIALLAAPAGHVWYALGAFVLFRLFDIFKPLGIRRMESLPGGIGVMVDDILSGVYGFIILIVARWIIS